MQRSVFYYLVVFGLLLYFSLSDCAENITEKLYQYSTDIELSSNLSAFWLKGILSVTKWENTTAFKFLNLESSVCEGSCHSSAEENLSNEHSAKYSLANLHVPFLLINDGKKHLMFSENETIWSRNIKRGIASFLDVDNETTLTKPRHYGRYMLSSQELRNSFQTENNSYQLSKNDDGLITMLAAESRGKYMGLESQGNHLRTKQKIELMSVKTHELMNKNYDAPQKMIKHAIEFEFSKYDSRIADFERFVNNQSHMIYLIQRSFDELIGYFKNETFHSNVSHLQRSRSLPHILSLMKQMDLNGLRQLYTKLDTKEKRLIFLSLLSYIGTDASVLFMCQLYHNGMLEFQLYSKYLMEMPFYHTNTTEKSLKAWLTCHQSTVASEKNVNKSDQIDRAFYLAFGVMFNKVYKYQLENLFVIPDTTQEKSFFLKFIRSLYANFEKSETKEQQLETLDVLKNVLAGSAMLLNYLNETVVHNKSLAVEVRLSACRLPARKIINLSNKQVFTIYSPVLMNDEEPLALRATALDVILQHGALHLLYPLITNLKRSPHLFNYFYSHMDQLSRSSNPHDDKLKILIADYNFFMDAPTERSSTSFVKKLNYFSPNQHGGRELLIQYIAEPTTSLPHLLHVQLSSFDLQDVLNDYTVYIELHGLNKYFLANVLKKINETIPLEAIPELFINHDPKIEGDIDIVVEKYGYVLKRVSHRLSTKNHGDQESTLGEKLLELLSVGNQEYEEWSCRSDSVLIGTNKLHKCGRNSVHKSIGLLHHEENLFITDTGFTVMHSYSIPYYYQHSIRNELAMDTGMHFSFFSRLWHAKESKLSIYNPFLKSWTGVARLQTTVLQLPFNVEGFKITNKQVRGIFLNTNDSLKKFLLEVKTDIYNFTENFGLKNELIEDVFENLESVPITAKYSYKKFGLDIEMSVNEQGCGSFPQAIDVTSSNWAISHALFGIVAIYSGNSAPGICNFKLMTIPSESSTKISVDLKVSGKYTDTHPLSGKQLRIQGNVSIIGDALGQLRSYTFNTNFTSSSNDVSTVINTKLRYYAGGQPDGDDYFITFSKKFPPIGEDAFAYGWGDETVNTRLDITCASGKCMQITFDIMGEISDEQKALSHSDRYPYSRCRQEQKQAVWQGPLMPRTWACYEAAIRLFYTRKVSLNANYKNIPKNVEDLTVAALSFINSYLSNYLNNLEMSKNTNEGNIQFAITHSATTPKLDINFSTPIGSFHFKDVPGIDKDIYNIQLDNTHFSKAIQFFESTALVRSCIINAESVLTPDNSTVQHTFNSSYDLLTSTFDRKFAVLAKKSTNGMAVKILIGNLSLEITPTDTQLNGNRIANLENGFEFPKGEPYYMFRIWKNRGQVTVYSKVLLFYFIHSPISITLDLPVIYLGQVVGLCGNLDLNKIITTS